MGFRGVAYILTIICSVFLTSCGDSQQERTERIRRQRMAAKEKVNRDMLRHNEEVDSMNREMFLKNMNKGLPMSIGKGLTQQKTEYEGDYAVLYVLCDENIIDLGKMRVQKADVKANILDGIKQDPEADSFIKAVKAVKCGIIYRYYSDNPDTPPVDIIIENKEL